MRRRPSSVANHRRNSSLTWTTDTSLNIEHLLDARVELMSDRRWWALGGPMTGGRVVPSLWRKCCSVVPSYWRATRFGGGLFDLLARLPAEQLTTEILKSVAAQPILRWSSRRYSCCPVSYIATFFV